MAGVLKLISPTFLLIFIGWIFGFRRKDKSLKIINDYALYVALPALLFKAIIENSHFEEIKLDFFMVSLVGILISFLLSFLIAKKYYAYDSVSSSIMAMASSYGNTGYMGLPMMLMVFSKKSLVPASMAAVLSNLPSILIAVFIIEFSQNNRQLHKRLSMIYIGRMVLKVFLGNPLISSIILGVLVNISSLQIPSYASKSLDMLALTAGPVGLFTLGLSLSAMDRTIFKKEILPRVAPIVLIKIFLHPLLTAICICFFSLRGFHDLWNISALVMAIQPIGAGAMSFSNNYKVLEKEVALAIVISLLISMITLPLILQILI